MLRVPPAVQWDNEACALPLQLSGVSFVPHVHVAEKYSKAQLHQ